MIDYQYLAGRVVRDPELRFTKTGIAVATFTLAQSAAYKDNSGQWQTAAERYVDVSVFDDPDTRRNPIAWARLAADKLTKGTGVVAHGRLITAKWQTKDGHPRSKLEFQADSLAISLNALAGATGQPAPAQSAWPATTPDSEQPPF